MSGFTSPAGAALAAPGLRAQYLDGDLDALLNSAGVLAVFGFGAAAPRAHPDPRYLHVALEPLQQAAPFEVWRVSDPVQSGRDDGIAWACDGHLLFGAIVVDEAPVDAAPVDKDHAAPVAGASSPLCVAAEHAYRRIGELLRARGYPHALRIWNYLDAVTEGAGDAERYRQFCVGRARGMAVEAVSPVLYPAATAIGRPAASDRPRQLQVYVLAARMPGRAVENPRQTSAYRYPRQYGPQPPSFARAMRAPDLPLMLSGTASVIGHASVHAGDLTAQLDETLRNLGAVAASAATMARFGPRSVLKAYVRERPDLPRVEAYLRVVLPDTAQWLVLHAEVCRAELMVEIDGWQPLD